MFEARSFFFEIQFFLWFLFVKARLLQSEYPYYHYEVAMQQPQTNDEEGIGLLSKTPFIGKPKVAHLSLDSQDGFNFLCCALVHVCVC